MLILLCLHGVVRPVVLLGVKLAAVERSCKLLCSVDVTPLSLAKRLPRTLLALLGVEVPLASIKALACFCLWP